MILGKRDYRVTRYARKENHVECLHYALAHGCEDDSGSETPSSSESGLSYTSDDSFEEAYLEGTFTIDE